MGDGTLKAPSSYAAKQPAGVGIGDFDGDKKLDLVAGQNRTQDVAFLAGKGDGTFKPGVNILTNQVYPGQVFPIDYNKDGKLDFFVNHTGGSPTLHLGNGDGTFADAQVVPMAPQSNSELWVGDVNQDGIYDLVSYNIRDTMVHVLVGKAGGGFAAELKYPAPETGFISPYGGIAVGDLNGDKLPDIAVVGSGDTKVFILLNTSK